ncbi:LtfC-like domain-containing protein [Nocardia xishanensis]
MSGLGHDAAQRPLILARGRAFVHRITPRTTPFPAGMTAQIEIRDSTESTLLDTWPGTVTTTAVDWNVPAATADSIPAGARYTLAVVMPTAPPTPYDWYAGPVVRRYRQQ